MKKTEISIVIPAYNEEKNVIFLYKELKEVLNKLGKEHEIIFIDDGSNDKTFDNLEKIHDKDKKVKIIRFRKNFGQTAAMDAGFKFASGNIVVAMDADLQNDPHDIPRLIKKLEKGYDCVSGWRKNRKDPLMKKIFSGLARLMRKAVIGDKIHDSGCSLKAYRKECFEDLDLYGEMHRFIPALLKIKGFKIGEMIVKHRKRKFGKTKYSIKRLLKGFVDLINVWFWQKYSSRPLHLFGGVGIFVLFFGVLIGVYLTVLKFLFGKGIGDRPLLLLAILLVVLGVQFLIFGVLGDMLVRMYYREKKNYQVKEVLK